MAIALGFTIAATNAAAAEPPLSYMHGLWRGENHMLLLDTERMQGNTDPDKPFERQAIIVRNVVGHMVTFDIGARRYIGLFEGDDLEMTGGNLEKSIRMRRVTR
ncbi:hypothetical protein [Bosea sp. ASV33]|uniref:hypothetical protein n=1 Tax=Bosea sp. ASV33 TaxID=2795106 RepID=UPI0018EE2D55|nr:hypothetical protein [Bosea sp. ASV33]